MNDPKFIQNSSVLCIFSTRIPGKKAAEREDLEVDVYEREGKLGRAHDFARITLAGIRLFKDDEMAVVECNFRVHGTTNLSVVDASVFPPIPGFFIVTAVYMISEKASDVILAGATVGPGFVKRMFRRVTRRGTLG